MVSARDNHVYLKNYWQAMPLCKDMGERLHIDVPFQRDDNINPLELLLLFFPTFGCPKFYLCTKFNECLCRLLPISIFLDRLSSQGSGIKVAKD